MREEETEADYVARLADELDAKFQRCGPDNVCAFVAETVSGSVSEHVQGNTVNANHSRPWDATQLLR